MLTFEYNAPERLLTCIISGRMDTPASMQAGDEINRKLTEIKESDNHGTLPGDRIVFDLADVNYISSSFIRICVNAAKQVPNGQFSIINCDPFLKKTFKIAGLDELLSVS